MRIRIRTRELTSDPIQYVAEASIGGREIREYGEPMETRGAVSARLRKQLARIDCRRCGMYLTRCECAEPVTQ